MSTVSSEGDFSPGDRFREHRPEGDDILVLTERFPGGWWAERTWARDGTTQRWRVLDTALTQFYEPVIGCPVERKGDEMNETREHALKTWPEFYEAVVRGDKPFEVRRNDRGFEVGDLLHLREWDPETGSYTGRHTFRSVTYALHGPQFGISDGYCVMGLS